MFDDESVYPKQVVLKLAHRILLKKEKKIPGEYRHKPEELTSQ